MPQYLMYKIVELCLAADKKAAVIYHTLSKLTEDEEFASFWRRMSDEEIRHVGYWERLAELASQGGVPQIFDKPYEVIEELKAILPRVDSLMAECRKEPSVSKSFLVAFRLEYYLMHSAFETLFHFTKHLTGHGSPEDDYDRHLDGFIEGLRKFGAATPELELLGETVRRLWDENRKLTRNSNIDELTGVLNRRGLVGIIRPLSRLAQRGGQNVAVLMLDLDNFKQINDTYGHLAGDKVLHEVAGIIKDSVRSSDIVARYGGEEFIVFLSSVRPNALEELAEDIRRRVERFSTEGINVTLSIGAAQGVMGMDVEGDLDRLISRADRLMYDAKKAGKNRVAC